MNSRFLTALAIALGFSALSSCDRGGGGSGSTPLPSTTQCTLTAMAQEQAFVESSGSGSVIVQVDPTTTDAFAYIINSQRYIFLPPGLALQPPEVQGFFLYHEFGHHYANHHARYGAMSCKVAEYEADAFATRVLYSKAGPASLDVVTDWFKTFGNQGDATHRTKTERVLYIEQVLASAQAAGAACPEIPAEDCLNSPLGTLWLTNPAFEAIQILANGQLLGVVAVGQKGIFLLPPGPVFLEFWGTFFHPFLGFTFYGSGTYTIGNGEITSI